MVERGREMYSAEISRQTLFTLRKKIRKHFPKLARALDKASRQMLELEEDLKASQNPYQVLSNPGVLPVTFLTISGELEEILEEKNLLTLVTDKESLACAIFLFTRKGKGDFKGALESFRADETNVRTLLEAVRQGDKNETH